MTLKKLFKTVLLVLGLAALPVLGLAQGSVTATGTVVDEGGEPIVGAGIFVKGTTVGTTSDFDGNLTVVRGEFHAAGDSSLGSTVGYTYFVTTLTGGVMS